MARLARPALQWPLLHYHCCAKAAGIHRCLRSVASEVAPTHSSVGKLIAVHNRGLRQWQRRIEALSPSDVIGGEDADIEELESEEKKSKNQRKRDARRAVRWGMEISSFHPNQIKRILKVASLERDVFDAFMLVKRFGPDIKEGKRRQYNYIGKLMRDVNPDLMDALILSTKDGDWSRMNSFSDLEMTTIADDDYGEEFDEPDDENSDSYTEMANRWFDGLISRDADVTRKIYAIRSDNFNRQELRKLVRIVHELQQKNGAEDDENEADAATSKAKKRLSRFLIALARSISNDASSEDE